MSGSPLRNVGGLGVSADGTTLYASDYTPYEWGSPTSIVEIGVASGSTRILVPSLPAIYIGRLVVGDNSPDFGTDLYVSDNNAELTQDCCGGGIFRVDRQTGSFTDASGGLRFTDTGGTDEYGLAFAPSGSPFGHGLYIVDGTWGPFGRPSIMRWAGGAVTQVAYFSDWSGRSPNEIAFGPADGFGGDIYISDRLGPTYGLPEGIFRVKPDGSFTTFYSGLAGSMAFGRGGEFGTDLYVLAGTTIYRITPDAQATEFASGIPASTWHRGVLTFSPDGQHLYVGAADRIIDVSATASVEPSTMPFEGTCDRESYRTDITCDPETGLEWLDMPLTDGRSMAEMRAELATTFQGWRHATGAEVLQLAFDAGIPLMDSNPIYPAGSSLDNIPALVALVNTAGAWGAGGFVADSVWNTGTHGLGIIQTTVGAYTSNTDPGVETVHWLVRSSAPPAEPPTFAVAMTTVPLLADFAVSGRWRPSARCLVTARGGGVVAFLSTDASGAFAGTISSNHFGPQETTLGVTCAGGGGSASSGRVNVTVDAPNPVLAVESQVVALPQPVRFGVTWFTYADCRIRSESTEVGTAFSEPYTSYLSGSVVLLAGTHTLTAECQSGAITKTSEPVQVQVTSSEAIAPTPAGSDVSVTPTDAATGQSVPIGITFGSVTTSGTTTVTTSTVGSTGSPPPPDAFKLGNPPTYYDITTTAAFAGTATVCVTYGEGQYSNESKLRLLHRNATTGKWEDITAPGYPDTQTNTICGVTSSFSPFLVGQLSYPFSGFFQPVDNPGTTNLTNRARAGAAIPVKFSLGGDRGLNIFETGYPKSGAYNCTAAPEDAIETTVNAGGSSLSYDPVSGQYTYVWKTDAAWANSCRRLTLTFADGSTRDALFHFVK